MLILPKILERATCFLIPCYSAVDLEEVKAEVPKWMNYLAVLFKEFYMASLNHSTLIKFVPNILQIIMRV